MTSRYRSDWHGATMTEIIAGLRQWCGRVEAKQPALARLLSVAGLTMTASQEELWEDGYDQAAREVLSEVKSSDVGLYMRLLTKFPAWRTLMKREDRRRAKAGL